jgi:3-hydroxyisobutyrate dehydrogenase
VSDPLVVAVIGLGRMGGPMADNAVAAGLDVRVFDIDPAAVAARVEKGAMAPASPADAARGADVVSVVVFDDAQALEVIAGDGGVLDVLTPPAVVVLHTTVTVETVEVLGSAAAAKGVGLIDAGVSGGEPGARAGTLVTMVGGEAEAVDRARPALDAYSREVVHAGPLGAGMAMKLARNSVGYTMMAAAHEAMALSSAAGVDLAQLRHVLEITQLDSMLYSPFGIGGPEPLPADADEGFRRAMVHTHRLGVKDIAQALALAERHGVEMPAAEAARAEFAAVMRLRPDDVA